MNQDDWLNFWFKPQLFMHESWVGQLDNALLDKQSSALAWHLSFDYVCDTYRLNKEYQELEDGLVKNILRELLANDETILDLASMMISSVAIDKNMSTETRRKILQRNRALSLKKRFLNVCQKLDAKEFGIYFIFLAVTISLPSLWSRVRLMFAQETVAKIEQICKEVPRLASNDAAIRRAWKEIFNLKQELKPDFAMANVDDTLASMEADAANDVPAHILEAQEQAMLEQAEVEEAVPEEMLKAAS
ncbi:hypothetical protein TDB9533_00043 [Thalassocella blandensis]|nr:hypothetical protein TDB9533_00043 [Thalassocella blandensis]